MKLLVITQKVSKNDPLLGFFHGWLVEFSKHFESIVAVCLEKGDYDLPANIKVLSLGKEAGKSRITQVGRLYRYVWQERGNYDAVFVHMNQEYVILAGLLWRGMGKKIMMWRNHPYGNILTRLAVLLSHKVFCTSEQSFVFKSAQSAKTTKVIIMPVGIDTSYFVRKPDISKDFNKALYLGRISPVKNIDIIIKSIKAVKDSDTKMGLTVVGDSTDNGSYLDSLKAETNRLGISDSVAFMPSVTNQETPRYYNSYGYSINATQSGSFDKTICEAMACEQIVLTSNPALAGKVDDRLLFKELDAADLAAKLGALSKLPIAELENIGKNLRNFIIKEHSLSCLASDVHTIADSL